MGAEGMLPANVDAERAVLGSILLDNTAYYAAAESIRPEYFSLDSHRRIYGAMLELDADREPIDTVTIMNRLAARKELELVGGAEYLAGLTDGLPRGMNVRYYVAIIREKAMLRGIYHTCESVMNRVTASDATTANCAGGLEDALLRLRAQNNGGQIQRISEFVDAAHDHLMELSHASQELVGLSTGIESIDELTTGIREHQLWMVGGRTGEGKSCIAAQAIVANASKGVPVLLFTPEMNREQVLMRIWIQISCIPAWKFSMPWFMNKTDRAALEKAKDRVAKWPLFLDDSSSITAQELAARARMANKQDGVRLVVVDYVQLIDSRGKDARERVSLVSQHLRALAKDVAPVLALSQMPRPADRDLNRCPTKYDLKESGSLENDSATILMIWRKVDPATSTPTGEDYIVVPKQRFGPTGIKAVHFDDDSLRYLPRQTEFGQTACA